MTRQPVHLNQQRILSTSAKTVKKDRLNNTPGQRFVPVSVDTQSTYGQLRGLRISHMWCKKVKNSKQARQHKSSEHFPLIRLPKATSKDSLSPHELTHTDSKKWSTSLHTALQSPHPPAQETEETGTLI